MFVETKSQIASRTAKGGINAEYNVAEKFNNWRTDKDAKRWLREMNYNLKEIESVSAKTVGGLSEKTDVAVNVIIYIQKKKRGERIAESVENIQVKKVSNTTGSNQMERKHVDKYIQPWHMPKDVVRILKLFTGEIKPDRVGTISSERMYMDEMTDDERSILKEYLEYNMVMIISDITRGRGRYAVEWMLVMQDYIDSDGTRYYEDMLLSINEVINFYVGDHTVEFPPQRKDGTQAGIRMGRITIQRKGGDDPTSLQFKSDPTKLFTLKPLFLIK